MTTLEIGKPRGFTLLELLVTGLIVGLIALVAWPSLFQSASHRKARYEADALMRRLERVRFDAVRSGKEQTDPTGFVTFYPDGTAAVRSPRQGVQIDETGRISAD